MFAAMDISTSALVAQRTHLDVIAGNVANMHTTRDDGTAYRRQVAIFAEGDPGRGAGASGVHIQSIARDPSPFHKRFEPNHTHAIKSGPNKGYVMMPNVDPSTEMVNAMMAARAYEANVTVMEITKTMTASSLRLLA